MPLDLNELRCTPDWRLYHPAPVCSYGLVSSSLCQHMFGSTLSETEGGDFQAEYAGQRVHIQALGSELFGKRGTPLFEVEEGDAVKD